MGKFGNFLRRSPETQEAPQKTGWEQVEAMGKSSQFNRAANAPVSAMSPDVARMQAQMREMQKMAEIQKAREAAFNAALGKANKAAGVDKFRGYNG